jgi:outer membrane immunogenic protein
MRNSNLIVLGAAAIGIILDVGAATAADLSAKAPVYKAPAAAAWSWTGFYLGANVGGAWSDNERFNVADPFNTFGLTGGLIPAATTGRGSGVVGGIHGGYNWQIGPQFLLGIEADISGADVKFSTRQQPLVSTFTNSDSFFTSTMNVRALASVRGRAGLAFGDWLLFGTGGWGWADTRFSADSACLTTGVNGCGTGVHAPISVSSSKSGAVFGGGFEYHMPNTSWIVGAEYLRYQLNGSSGTGVTSDIATGAPVSFAGPPCTAGTACVNYNASSLGLNEVRVRASYKFGGPIAARY